MKLTSFDIWRDRRQVSPALRGGRGLKPIPALTGLKVALSIARPARRAWIETILLLLLLFYPCRIARPARRAWIETKYIAYTAVINQRVSPALRGGRGLKLISRLHITHGRGVSPALRGGRGLKRRRGKSLILSYLVSPALRGGRGLKHVDPPRIVHEARVSPALRGGRGLKLARHIIKL